MDKRFEIKSLVRKNILEMKPYSSARDDFSGTASVFLDANENPYNPPLNRYPDPHQMELKKIISRIKGQPVESLFLGNGSDEGIDILIRVLCEPGRDNVVSVDPTYGMYGVCAQINDVARKSVLLTEDFSLDPQAVLQAADERTKIIFLCSPNNPTSNMLKREAIRSIIEQVNCMVVVDEAYIDFSSEPGLLSLLPETKNLVVLQTLSKARGLAGIRLGMVFAHPELINTLSGVKYPYNLNTLSIETAIAQLTDQSIGADWVENILKERQFMADQLNSLSFVEKVYPSEANFLLVKMVEPRKVYTHLMQLGIIVRDRSSLPLCEGCLRITVGTEQENRLLIEALSTFGR